MSGHQIWIISLTKGLNLYFAKLFCFNNFVTNWFDEIGVQTCKKKGLHIFFLLKMWLYHVWTFKLDDFLFFEIKQVCKLHLKKWNRTLYTQAYLLISIQMNINTSLEHFKFKLLHFLRFCPPMILGDSETVCLCYILSYHICEVGIIYFCWLTP